MVIPTDKFEETVNFYQTILDFPFSVAKDEAIAKIDNFLLNIVKTDTDSIFFPTGNGMYLSFLFSDLTAIQKRIPESNLIREWKENGIKFVVAKDPNKNLILFKELTSSSSKEQESLEISSAKVSFLSSLLRSYTYAIQNLITSLRKHGFRDDIIQKIVEVDLRLEELFLSRTAYLSKIPQTLSEKKDFDSYYAQSSQSLQLLGGYLERLLDVISQNSELLDNIEIQKALGISRSVIRDSQDLLNLGNEKR